MGKQAMLYSFPDVGALADALREYVLSAQADGLKRHGVFKVAVSGGSLPKTLAQALLPAKAGAIQWDHWEIFFADERAVPLDDDDSNYKLVKRDLLDRLPADGPQPTVHPIAVEHLDDLQELADSYEQMLVRSFAAKDSIRMPMFDLMLLGCGPDGHTCSLFPNHPLLRETDAWVAPVDDSPKPPAQRITLTLPVVTHSLRIAFVATGPGKKDILQQIFDSEDGQGLPSGLVNAAAGDRVSWFTDRAAVDGVAYPKKTS
ncbi:MAG: suppressor of los1-1 [Phylliscum demangeonii]|nr:MAG: suppressor of los1-1 [Phylliscum demangeonii]